jgi:hypothetical protein
MYTEKFGHLREAAAPGAMSVSGTGLATPVLNVMSQCAVNRLVFTVLTSPTGGTAPILQFYFRPTPASTSGQVTLGTMTIPDATAIGKVVYKDVSPDANILTVGGQVCCCCSTADTVGTGYWGIEATDSPANAKAVSIMIASA